MKKINIKSNKDGLDIEIAIIEPVGLRAVSKYFNDNNITFLSGDFESALKGIKKGSVVGIFLDKCLESIISILAILKNDAVFLPIDVNYPLERISFMINDSSCELVLSKAPYIDNISDISTVLDVESINSSNNHLKRSPLNSLKQPAYIMYTSGSTGKPKGVVVNNQNIIRLVTHPNYIDFRDDDRILQTGSIVFDACTFEIWGALLLQKMKK